LRRSIKSLHGAKQLHEKILIRRALPDAAAQTERFPDREAGEFWSPDIQALPTVGRCEYSASGRGKPLLTEGGY
jgi:hypothetical protein